MIYNINLGSRCYNKNYYLFLRFVFNNQVDSFKRLFNKNIIYNLFYFLGKNSMFTVKLVSIKFIKRIIFNDSFLSKIIDIYLIFNFYLNKFSKNILFIRKKILLVTLPCININYSFLIGLIERTIVSSYKTIYKIFYYNDKFYEVSLYSINGDILKFIFKSNLIFVQFNESTLISFYSFISILGIDIRYFLNKFFKKINILILKFLILIKFKYFSIKNGFILIDVYLSNGRLLITRGSYINLDFYNKYKNHLCILNKDYYSQLVLSKKIIINGIVFKKYLRLNINKILFLIKVPKIIKVYALNNIYNSNISKIILKDFNCDKQNFYYSLLYRFNGSIGDNSYINPKSRIKFYDLFFKSGDFFRLSSFTLYEINNVLLYNKYSNLFLKEDIFNVIKFLIKNKSNNINNSFKNSYLIGVGYYIYDIIQKNFSKFIYDIYIRLNKFIILNFSKNNIFLCNILTNLIREFFTVSIFSQYLEHNNFLSELTHKRRLIFDSEKKSLGNTNSELRNIDFSYFSRICPLETPEGSSIGLVNSLAILSKIRFKKATFLSKIFVPYFYNFNNIFKIVYLNDFQEYYFSIAGIGGFCNLKYYKKYNKFLLSNKKPFKYNFITPIQLFSLSPLFIPFVNHNDGNRVLMGSNMQRQALPCLKPSIPFLVTGVECIPSISLNYCKVVSFKSKIEDYCSKFIIYSNIIKNIFICNIYSLVKYKPTNQFSCINQYPTFKYFFRRKILINDNFNTINGILCLGQNVLVAFLPWRGYNFEDSIIISDRLSYSDSFASIHIYKFKTCICKNKFNNDIVIKNNNDLTLNDINNINPNGIINVGSKVSSGSVLVCKYSSILKKRFDSFINLYDKIFNDKNYLLKKVFLTAPMGVSGVVTSVEIKNIFSRLSNKTGVISFLYSNNVGYDNFYNYNFRNILYNYFFKKKTIVNGLWFLKKNGCLIYEVIISLLRILIKHFLKYIILKYKILNKIFIIKYRIVLYYKISIYDFFKLIIINNRIFSLISNINIINNKININKIINDKNEIIVTVVCKKYLQVGDKMSGRYGNKGVISRILPLNEMPFFSDGSVCDMILNPIGIPSRMNIGQLFEIKFGLLIFLIFKCIKNLLKKNLLDNIVNILVTLNVNLNKKTINKFFLNFTKTLSFRMFSFTKLNDFLIKNINFIIFKNILLKRFLFSKDLEKAVLFDGVTGLNLGFISVGYLYFIKLYHIVDDKLHARSIGPYSSITKQPLKGKSNLGGQRLGEMEIWALEAYGVSYLINEMLVIKSNSVYNKFDLINSIYNDCFPKNVLFPETVNLLLTEIKSLCLDIKLF